MGKSIHERASDAKQKRVESVEDKGHKICERQLRQALHQVSLDDDFEAYDFDAIERRHHKVSLR